MKNAAAISTAIVTAVFSFSLCAETTDVKTVTRVDDPLVKELEGIYANYVAAVSSGDLATFRSLRTAKANQEIPATATGNDLKGMADFMAPSLDGFHFLQLDIKHNQARAAYKRELTGERVIRVMMFEREDGGWKVGDLHDSSHFGRIPPVGDALNKALKAPSVQFR